MIDTKILLNTLLHLLPVLYGIAFFNYILVFVTEEVLVRRVARPLVSIAVAVNAVYMLGFTIFFQHVPFVTVFQMLGAVAFSMAAIYLWVETKTESPYTGPFVLFIVLVFQIVNAEFPKLDGAVPDILQSKMFSFHVAAAVLGYSAFALGAVYGLLYLLLYHKMRGKDFGLVFRRLPSLDVLDRMNFYALVVGCAFLSLAISLGALWSYQLLHTWSLDAKVLVTLITLVVYGSAVFARWRNLWPGTRLAYSSLLGFLVVLFSVFGVNFFLTNFHEFLG